MSTARTTWLRSCAGSSVRRSTASSSASSPRSASRSLYVIWAAVSAACFRPAPLGSHLVTGRSPMAEPRRSTSTDPGDLKGARILVVEARFYEDISDELLKGATRVLDAAGVVYDRVSVPGSLEIPPAITIALDAAEDADKPYEGAVAL